MATHAIVLFRDAEVRRTFLDLLRDRLYAAGYLPHQVTELYDHLAWGNPRKTILYVYGSADAERACDVAHEVRGVQCKLRDD